VSVESDSAVDGQNSAPLVSVIVPAYRVEKFVAESLRSVQAQTMREWECLVVDDGSDDETARLVADFVTADTRIRLLRQANLGVSGARNTGLKAAAPGARYVAFLDPDDLWCEDALEQLVGVLESDPDAVGAFGYAELMDELGQPILPGVHPTRQFRRRRARWWGIRAMPSSEPVRFEDWVVYGPIWPPAVGLHRRKVVDLVGFFDPQLKQLEDNDFYTRMSRYGYYRPIDRQVAWYRQHYGQVTKRVAEFWYYHDALRRKTWESDLNTPRQRRRVVVAWRVTQARRIARCSRLLIASMFRRQWSSTRRLTKVCLILIAQGMRPGPPTARNDHVYLDVYLGGRDS
jgi:glycosyltransferase involved in cell wall biosynthesis